MDDAARAVPPLTPEALLARGEHRAAIEAAMDVYGADVFSFCWHNLKHRETAEDALQDVFLQAHRDIRRLEQPAKLRSWLMSIAAHRVYDAIDTRKRRQSRFDSNDEASEQAIDTSVDRADGPGEKLQGARLAEALVQCLEKLSDMVRISVVMRFYGQLSFEEMAAATRTKSDTLQTRVSRALPALRACLEAQGWDHHG